MTCPALRVSGRPRKPLTGDSLARVPQTTELSNLHGLHPFWDSFFFSLTLSLFSPTEGSKAKLG